MILLKVKIEDLELHRKSGQKETAEIIFNYEDCDTGKIQKINFPIFLDFNLLNKNEAKVPEFNLGKAKNKHYSFIDYNSESINLAIALYYTAKFLRKISKEKHKKTTEIEDSSIDVYRNNLNKSDENVTLEKLNDIKSELLNFIDNYNTLKFQDYMKIDLRNKIEKMINLFKNNNENMKKNFYK